MNVYNYTDGGPDGKDVESDGPPPDDYRRTTVKGETIKRETFFRILTAHNSEIDGKNTTDDDDEVATITEVSNDTEPQLAAAAVGYDSARRANGPNPIEKSDDGPGTAAEKRTSKTIETDANRETIDTGEYCYDDDDDDDDGGGKTTRSLAAGTKTDYRATDENSATGFDAVAVYFPQRYGTDNAFVMTDCGPSLYNFFQRLFGVYNYAYADYVQYKLYTRRHDKRDVLINTIFVEKTAYHCQGSVKMIVIKNNDCVPGKIIFK